MSSVESLFLVAIVEMAPGHAEAGARYEDAVLELLDRHGGSLERRMRGTDSTTEVQLIRFRSRAGYESFMVDPDRLAHRESIGDGARVNRLDRVDHVGRTSAGSWAVTADQARSTQPR